MAGLSSKKMDYSESWRVTKTDVKRVRRPSNEILGYYNKKNTTGVYRCISIIKSAPSMYKPTRYLPQLNSKE